MYELLKVLHSNNFNTPNDASSFSDIMDLPSISVDVSFPPMRTGAKTMSTKSISFSRRKIEFTVPPL